MGILPAKKILSSAQEEEEEGNEEGEDSKLERPGRSEQEKTTDGDAEMRMKMTERKRRLQ